MGDIQHETIAGALVAILGDLPGIEKKKHAGGVTYAYRGIEEITVALQPLLVKHGVVITPNATVVSVEPLPQKGQGGWTRTTLSVHYEIHLAGDQHGRQIIHATCIGVGDDNADKGANKAMTQAFKYLLLQTFCISDPADDGDGIPSDPAQVEAAEEVPVAPEGWDSAAESAKAHSDLSERVGKLPAEAVAECSKLRKQFGGGWPLPKTQFDELLAYVVLAESGIAAVVDSTSGTAPGDGF